MGEMDWLYGCPYKLTELNNLEGPSVKNIQKTNLIGWHMDFRWREFQNIYWGRAPFGLHVGPLLTVNQHECRNNAITKAYTVR